MDKSHLWKRILFISPLFQRGESTEKSVEPLKEIVIREAKNKGIYPVNYLEELVREKINPYGHTDIKDSVRYVRELRKKSKDTTDDKFLEEILKAIEKNLPLVTRNYKHYRKIKGLILFTGRK